MKGDVFLLAAGLGTRLRPLTDSTPKPLIEVNGKPLIVYHLERIKRDGFSRVMINLHYLPEKIRDFIGDGSEWDLSISYSFEPVLLDTGGGVKNIEPWLESENLLILNSDSLFDESFSISELLSSHLNKNGANERQMTLLVGPPSQEFTSLWRNDENKLVGFSGTVSPHEGATPVSYLGAMVLSRSLLASMPERGVPFSLTSGVIPQLLARGEEVGVVNFNGYWSDIGTPERLISASKYFTQVRS